MTTISGHLVGPDRESRLDRVFLFLLRCIHLLTLLLGAFTLIQFLVRVIAILIPLSPAVARG